MRGQETKAIKWRTERNLWMSAATALAYATGNQILQLRRQLEEAQLEKKRG